MATNTKPIYGSPQYPHMVFYFSKNPFMDIAKVIGANLTAWMENNPGLDTFKKIAARSGVGFGTVQRAKNGDGNITVEKLTAIAGAFKRHPAELMIPAAAVKPPEKLGDYRRVIDGEALRLEINEPPPAKVLGFPSPLLAELAAVAERINDNGLHRLIAKAQEIAEQHPRASSGNAAG